MEDDFNDLSGMFPELEGNCVMTDEQIKHMVDRFLGWQLPKDFNPDGGVSFERKSYGVSGTNLFDATQAEVMVRYMVEGMPDAASPVVVTEEMISRGVEAIYEIGAMNRQGVAACLRAALKK